MRIGVGLPAGVPGVDGHLLIEWARLADTGPFSSLGVVDRLCYDTFDPLVALASAAAVTQRTRLVTMIIIGPLYNTLRLAKASASIDALSGGRLVLGMAVGARREDYEAAGIEYRSRGKRFVEQLSLLRAYWEDPAIGPSPAHPEGPPILVGGQNDQVFTRIARYANGYVHGGGPPRSFARAADKTRAAWSDMRRPGKPQLWAQAYFALGDEDDLLSGERYLKEYYAFTGTFAEKVASGLLTTPQAIAQYIRGYAEAGCDELVLLPTVASLDQLKRLAEVLAGIDYERF
uniref:Monooxygenase n=1 Tax=Thermosporothrix sp. COM3 TaxID=2490863 RepID=A0A455SKY0_9CHLR|nr:monooxygenase [Thermosporothrix sp. COM3]